MSCSKLLKRPCLEIDQLFVKNGALWTSVGMTASIDMALAFVEGDLGPTIARNVARRMLCERGRFGSQPQTSNLFDLEPKSIGIQWVFEFVRSNFREILSIAHLADVARLSPRQFSRAVQTEFGLPLAKPIERLRVDGAQVLLVRRRLHSPGVDVPCLPADLRPFGARDLKRPASGCSRGLRDRVSEKRCVYDICAVFWFP